MDERSHLRTRVDVSRWMLHFVRDRDPTDRVQDHEDDPIPLEPDAGARAVLLNIIRETALRAGFSYRAGRPTVYGKSPAVCFTEMPLHSLLRYAGSRPDNRVGGFLVAVLREELFKAGARPVIYGASADSGERGANWLPERERYRYVAYEPGKYDWTHEREWRWPARARDRVHVDNVARVCMDVPGMHLFKGAFSSVGFVAPTEADADELVCELIRLRDRGCDSYGGRVNIGVLEKSFVVVASRAANLLNAGKLSDCTMEGLPAECKYPVALEPVTVAAKTRAAAALTKAREAASRAVQAYFQRVTDPMRDSSAYVWVETPDGRRAEVRALVEAEAAYACEGGYVINGFREGLATKLGDLYGPQEAAASAAAIVLEEQLGIETYVRHRWD